MYLIGYDCGTSSIKASLIESQTGKVVSSATAPAKEMLVSAPQPDWVEQNPKLWWDNLNIATQQILADSNINVLLMGLNPSPSGETLRIFPVNVIMWLWKITEHQAIVATI